MSMTLRDKTIVLVGGTSGIGLAAARACSQQGANLVLVGRDENRCKSACEQLPGPGRWLAVDACAPETAPQALSLATEAFGLVHGVCHVAGGSGRRWGDGPLHEISDDGLRKTLQWNLESNFFTSRAAVRYWLARESAGSLIHVGSVLADRPAPAFFATHAYSAAKAGIVGLTTAAAAYYAPNRIRINVVAPALVETPMSERACGDDSIRNYVRQRQPLTNGVAQPESVEGMIVFLFSNQAEAITGQVFRVDGGWSVCDAYEAEKNDNSPADP